MRVAHRHLDRGVAEQLLDRRDRPRPSRQIVVVQGGLDIEAHSHGRDVVVANVHGVDSRGGAVPSFEETLFRAYGDCVT